ncbi:MAG: hypothetical protein ABIJ46_03895 [bacterium]
MWDINEVHRRIKEKKKERRDLNRIVKDELAQNPEYQQVVEELKTLKERQKSIESTVKLSCSSEVDRMEVLKDEIAADTELLSDLALNMYVEGKTVEIVDEDTRYVPQFTVRFKKDDTTVSAAESEAAKVQRAEPHPERTFAPFVQPA